MAKISSHLTLIGDYFDLDYVTRLSGMNPTYLRRNDERLNNGRLFGHTEWGIASEPMEDDSIELSLDELLSKITCDPVELYEIAQSCNASWHIVIVIYFEQDELPMLYLSQRFIQVAGQLHAEMGFDTYELLKD